MLLTSTSAPRYTWWYDAEPVSSAIAAVVFLFTIQCSMVVMEWIDFKLTVLVYKCRHGVVLSYLPVYSYSQKTMFCCITITDCLLYLTVNNQWPRLSGHLEWFMATYHDCTIITSLSQSPQHITFSLAISMTSFLFFFLPSYVGHINRSCFCHYCSYCYYVLGYIPKNSVENISDCWSGFFHRSDAYPSAKVSNYTEFQSLMLV